MSVVICGVSECGGFASCAELYDTKSVGSSSFLQREATTCWIVDRLTH